MTAATPPAGRSVDPVDPVDVGDPVALGRPQVMGQRWSSIVWCHWPVPEEVVARRLPPGVRPDLFDGTAWVGLVPFEMRDLRLVVAGRSLPEVPTTGSFSEVNVRTYVTGPEGPGVWFDTLDASSRLGSFVARTAWSLPYVSSHIVASAGVGPGVRDWSIRRSDGATARVRTRVGERATDRSDLDHFLTERYALYARAWWNRRRALWAPVAHAPWDLLACTDVEVDAGVVRAAGYPVGDSPVHVRAADSVAVRVGLPRLV
jgi:uncharacterized protein YqjF (DUF2071 family)